MYKRTCMQRHVEGSSSACCCRKVSGHPRLVSLIGWRDQVPQRMGGLSGHGNNIWQCQRMTSLCACHRHQTFARHHAVQQDTVCGTADHRAASASDGFRLGLSRSCAESMSGKWRMKAHDLLQSCNQWMGAPHYVQAVPDGITDVQAAQAFINPTTAAGTTHQDTDNHCRHAPKISCLRCRSRAGFRGASVHALKRCFSSIELACSSFGRHT